MNHTTLPLAQLHKRNLWPLPSGDLAVRPGLRRTFDLTGVTPFGGFTLQKATTATNYHYIFVCDDTTAEAKLRTYDEDFVLLAELGLETERRPSIVTAAAIGLDVLFSSPDLPPLFGIIGSGTVFAEKVASINETATPAIDIPRGICVAWAGRAVIADGDLLFVSDGFVGSAPALRTFVGRNVIPLPGACYGLHVGNDGGLFLATTAGVYYLPEDVAGTGQIPDFDFAKASDYQALAYGNTTLSEGRVWGLTRRGLKVVDEANGAEVNLSDPVGPRAFGGRVHRDDWRNARMLGGERGPIVIDEQSKASWFFDVPRAFQSWWSTRYSAYPDGIEPVAVLRRFSGEDLLLMTDGVYRAFGNQDWESDDTADLDNDTQPRGVAHGKQDIPPVSSPNLREVYTSTDATSGDALIAVRSTVKSGEPTGPKAGLVIGTAAWDAGATYEQPELRSRRGQFVYRGDEPYIEVGAERCLQRIVEAATIGYQGVSPRRPS